MRQRPDMELMDLPARAAYRLERAGGPACTWASLGYLRQPFQGVTLPLARTKSRAVET